MSNERHQKIDVSALSIGMFISELDRPWIESPFLLEGVLIEEQSQIDTIVALCQYVYIDLGLSVGTFDLSQKTSTPKTPSAAKPIKPKAAYSTDDQFSFFDVLKDIKKSNQNKKLLAEHVSSNTLYIEAQHKAKGTVDIPEEPIDDEGLTEQIRKDIAGIISGLKQRNGQSSGDKTLLLAEHLAKKQTKNDKALFPVEQEMVKVFPTFEKAHVATREIFEAIAQDKHIDIHKVDESLTGMVESIERNPDALMWLAKLKQTDNEAYNQAMTVSITMMALANFMALPKKQVKELGMASLLQDIGKAKIHSDLLNKVEKITEQDYQQFQRHVDYTIQLLNQTDNIPQLVRKTVAQHHERIDGSGYPNKLTGKQISLTGQMAGLVDTYCALTNDRVYAKGVYSQQALEEIHKLRNIKFNGVIIDQLVQFLGMYPVTSLVELNTGEVGVVIEQNSVRRLLPRVLVILNADKTRNPSPMTLNLINRPLTPSGEPYAIKRGLPPDSFGLNPSNYYA